MMRDFFGRPVGLRSSLDPWSPRRAPVRPSAPSPPEAAPPPPRSLMRPSPRVPVPLRVPVEVPEAEVARSPGASADRTGSRSGGRDELPSPAPPVDAPREARPAEPPARAVQVPGVEAELEASRVRLAREAVREREADKLRLVAEILPVLDDLDRSVAAARRSGGVTPLLLEGFELVRTRLERVLEGYGLERIAAQGVRFDPALHEAIALVEVHDPKLVGVVVDEIERGYRAGDRVLRAARVRVGSAG